MKILSDITQHCWLKLHICDQNYEVSPLNPAPLLTSVLQQDIETERAKKKIESAVFVHEVFLLLQDAILYSNLIKFT